MFSWSDLADVETLAAALGFGSISAVLGVQAARQLHLGQFWWLSALIGASTIIFSMMPSMILCGSIGGGLLALLEFSLGVQDAFPVQNLILGKTVVVISTALGCAFVAWVTCLFLLSPLAVIVALRRRSRSA